MKKAILLFPLFIWALSLAAQKKIYLWSNQNMPNSKGLVIKDSVANERVYHVGSPYIEAFFTSDQENTGGAVLIIPGGGYARLAHEVSGRQLAKWFNIMGMDAFVLIHRLPHSPDLVQRHMAPIQDAQRAFKIIRKKGKSWGIHPDKIGVMGSSAGGHLAATLSNFVEDFSIIGDEIDKVSYKPNFQILVSPVIDFGVHAHEGSRENLLGKNPPDSLVHWFSMQCQVTKDTPPAFLVHAANDKGVKPINSTMYVDALLKHNVMCSFHLFPGGGHNISLRDNPGSASMWVSLCEKWLIEIGVLSRNE